MNFTGITLDEFNIKYSKGVIAALGSITKLQASAVTALPAKEILTGTLRGTGATRKLQQSNLHPVNKVRGLQGGSGC